MDIIIDGGASNMCYALFNENSLVSINKVQGTNFMHGIEHISFDAIPDRDNIDNFYLFGAGIRPEDDNSALEQLVRSSFPNADKVHLANDLELTGLAFADRADCIISIIGTGSNAAHCIDGVIKKNIIAGGYVLGDQGSGYKLGKKVLQYYIENQFTKAEDELFLKMYGYSKFDIVKAVYDADNTKRFVAKHSQFLSHLNASTKKDIISLEFYKFFQNVNKQIPNSITLEYNFSGSIAYHFSDELKVIGQDNNINIGKVIQSPFEEIETIYKYIKQQL